MLKLAFAVLAASLVAGPVLAQSATKIRGTVVSVDGTVLRLKDRAGADFTVAMAPTYTVTAVVAAKLADVAQGSYIGAAADPGPDGTLVAREIHIFPEAMRGSGEGFRAFDLGPQSTMTNGTVGNEVKGAVGDRLTVAYKGGEKSIVVPPNAPVVMFAPGDRAMVKPGAAVIVQAQKGEGGGLTAERVTVGKDGLVPPM